MSGYGDGQGDTVQTKRYLHGAAVDQVLAQEDVSTNAVLWHLADNLGTVRNLVDNSGTLTHFTYDSFGKLTSGGTPATRYLYTGRELDTTTGLQYNRARWYDPAVGRWISEDPIGFEAQDANLSRYVGNSPTNNTDPSGLLSWHHDIDTPPKLEGELGYELKVVQTLRVEPGEPQVPAPRGTQSWQINDIETFLVLSDGKRSSRGTLKRRVLDIKTIGGQQTPYRSVDTVGFYGVGNVPPGQKIVLAIEKVTKKLGFRPYEPNTFKPLGKLLPPRLGKDATKGENEILATIMGPFLEAETLYIFIDGDGCKGVADQIIEEARAFVGAVPGAPALDLPQSGKYEFYKYADLGSWSSKDMKK